MAKDYYAILGVNKTASDDEIKKAFRRLAHEHHPDKGGEPAKFKDVNEAYQVLSDKQKRQTYDQFGSAAFEQGAAGPGGFGGFGQGFGGFDFGNFQAQDLGDLGDVLGEMFGFGGGRSKTARGKDIEVDVELAFKEAAFGVERTIKLYKNSTCSHCRGEGGEPGSSSTKCATCDGSGQVRQTQRTMFGNIQTVATCPTCHGRGKTWKEPCKICKGSGIEKRESSITLHIPGGISSGEAVRVAGEGEAVPHGRAGDLYVRVQVKSDPRFTRELNDVRSEAEVPFTTLTLGGTIEVETLDGKTKLEIPEATRSGTVFKLRGKGIPFLRSSGRGDQLITVTAEVPRHPSREQKKLLEDLKRSGL